jgi:hypothetical protein
VGILPLCQYVYSSFAGAAAFPAARCTINRLMAVSASKAVSKKMGQSQEQHKNAKDTHYCYIDHALIA